MRPAPARMRQRASIDGSSAASASRMSWSSALRLAGLSIVSRTTCGAGSSRRSLPPASSTRYPSTTSVSPSLTAWPSSQRISRTTPSSSASTGISIFIDSRITTVSPSATVSPTSTSILHTVPVMCASTLATLAPRSPVGGTIVTRLLAHGEPAGPRADPSAGLQGPAPGVALRPLPSARPHARARLGVRGRQDRHLADGVDVLPRAQPRRREGADVRPRDPRAEPLLVHGPLLHRRVHPPARPLHGQVAALRAADAVDLQPRWRV